MPDGDVRVLDATRRFGARSPKGYRVAVRFIVEGEPRDETMWFDEFIETYCGANDVDVTVGGWDDA